MKYFKFFLQEKFKNDYSQNEKPTTFSLNRQNTRVYELLVEAFLLDFVGTVIRI